MFSLSGEETAFSILMPRTRCAVDKLFETFLVVTVLFGFGSLKVLGNGVLVCLFAFVLGWKTEPPLPRRFFRVCRGYSLCLSELFSRGDGVLICVGAGSVIYVA